MDASYGTCRNVLKRNLGMYYYKLQMHQELLPPDYIRTVAGCLFFNTYLNDAVVLDKTFFTDKAWFHFNVHIKSQNMRMCVTEYRHFDRETTLHPVKIGIWCAMSRRKIIGPIFFVNSTW